MPTTSVRNANAERQARFRAARTPADKEQRNKDLRARRALRRELHERRRLTLTTARNTRAPLLLGATPVVSVPSAHGIVGWHFDVSRVCVQGGVPRSLPRQIPTIQQVREHIAHSNWRPPDRVIGRFPVVGAGPTGRYLAVSRG